MKIIHSWEEIPQKLRTELEEELAEDILERYNNSEYHDPILIEEFLADNDYKLV